MIAPSSNNMLLCYFLVDTKAQLTLEPKFSIFSNSLTTNVPPSYRKQSIDLCYDNYGGVSNHKFSYANNYSQLKRPIIFYAF